MWLLGVGDAAEVFEVVGADFRFFLGAAVGPWDFFAAELAGDEEALAAGEGECAGEIGAVADDAEEVVALGDGAVAVSPFVVDAEGEFAAGGGAVAAEGANGADDGAGEGGGVEVAHSVGS